MFTRKALYSSAWCNNCRLALLKAFISSSGFHARPNVRPRYIKIGARNSEQLKSFGTSTASHSDVVQEQSSDSPIIEETSGQGTEQIPTEEHDDPETASSTPWYLQVEPPKRASNPLLERQRLPQLPPDPPPLLGPMLEYVSIDLGLDDLTLFDLRDVDPPPALGANLLMIIGTARSEKHLHISADRFCRWLKVTQKLSPYADGLLGRGEMKLKLKRKARRARLLSKVGVSETGNADDGLRTGWICVNVGIIQDGRDIDGSLGHQEAYVGFGREPGRAKVVVQMLTQEKREELDLEDLWGKMLRRHERKEDRITKGQDQLLSEQEVGQNHLSEKRPMPDSRFLTIPEPLKRPLNLINQVRHLHHYSHCSTAALDSHKEAYSKDVESQEKRGGHKTPHEDRNEHFRVDPSASEETLWEVEKHESRIMKEQEEADDTDSQRSQGARFSHLRIWKESAKYRKNLELDSLRQHVNSLWKLSREDTIKALGRDASDHDSTAFLKSFYEGLPQSLEAEHWELLLALVSHGVVIGHPGYGKAQLALLSQKMQLSIKPPERVLRRLFHTFLIPNLEKAGIFRKTGTALPKLTKESIVNAIITLHVLHSHGFDIETRDIRYKLYRAAIMAFRDGPRIRTGDPGRLMWALDTLNARLHHSPSYSVCLRLLVESCEILQRDPQFPKAERVKMVSAYLGKPPRQRYSDEVVKQASSTITELNRKIRQYRRMRNSELHVADAEPMGTEVQRLLGRRIWCKDYSENLIQPRQARFGGIM